MRLDDLDLDREYTYADYYQWKFSKQVELIEGKVHKMSHSSNKLHQQISKNLFNCFRDSRQNSSGKILIAPFEMRLPSLAKNDKEIHTVLQPDIAVTGDHAIIFNGGCLGEPDIVVEILRYGDGIKELKYKYKVYEAAGVKEYWIVMPAYHFVQVFTLVNNKFEASPIKTTEDEITTPILPGLALKVDMIFKEEDFDDGYIRI